MWLVATILNVTNIIEYSICTFVFCKDISDQFFLKSLQEAGLETLVAGQTDRFLL